MDAVITNKAEPDGHRSVPVFSLYPLLSFLIPLPSFLRKQESTSR